MLSLQLNIITKFPALLVSQERDLREREDKLISPPINPAALGCLPVFDGPTVLTKTGGSVRTYGPSEIVGEKSQIFHFIFLVNLRLTTP